MKIKLLTVFIILLFFTHINAQQLDSTKSLIKQTSDNTYQLQNISINSEEKEVKFPAKINMQEGLIEVFACAPGGKMHESVLVADIVPYYLQVSLLLLGLQSSESEKYNKIGDLINNTNFKFDDETLKLLDP